MPTNRTSPSERARAATESSAAARAAAVRKEAAARAAARRAAASQAARQLARRDPAGPAVRQPAPAVGAADAAEDEEPRATTAADPQQAARKATASPGKKAARKAAPSAGKKAARKAAPSPAKKAAKKAAGRAASAVDARAAVGPDVATTPLPAPMARTAPPRPQAERGVEPLPLPPSAIVRIDGDVEDVVADAAPLERLPEPPPRPIDPLPAPPDRAGRTGGLEAAATDLRLDDREPVEDAAAAPAGVVQPAAEPSLEPLPEPPRRDQFDVSWTSGVDASTLPAVAPEAESTEGEEGGRAPQASAAEARPVPSVEPLPAPPRRRVHDQPVGGDAAAANVETAELAAVEPPAPEAPDALESAPDLGSVGPSTAIDGADAAPDAVDDEILLELDTTTDLELPAEPQVDGALLTPAEDLDPVDPAADRPWLRSYPPGVPATYRYPLVPMTRFLDDAAQDFPDVVALSGPGARTTYRQLLDRVDRMAAALQDHGVRPGDRVSLLLPSSPQHVVSLHAVWRVGAVAVEHPRLDDAQSIAAELEAVRPSAVVVADDVVERLAGVLEQRAGLDLVIGTAVDAERGTGALRSVPLRRRPPRPSGGQPTRLEVLVERSAPTAVQVAVDPPVSPAVILCRRGGAAPVVLTHLNLVAAAFQARLWIPDVQAGRERVLIGAPMSSAFGLSAGLAVGILSAATLVLVPRAEAAAVGRVAASERPTLIVLAPAAMGSLAEATARRGADLRTLRAVVVAGPADAEATRRVEASTGARVRRALALDEASGVVAANPIYGRSKPGTSGLPLTDTDCWVFDPADPDRRLGTGIEGDLLVDGPQVAQSRWLDHGPVPADDVVPGGALRTGARATIDADGYVTVSG